MSTRLLASFLAATALAVAFTIPACGGDDDQGCGDTPVGTACRTTSGSCISPSCTSSGWACPDQTTSVAATPESCGGSIDAAASDAAVTTSDDASATDAADVDATGSDGSTADASALDGSAVDASSDASVNADAATRDGGTDASDQ